MTLDLTLDDVLISIDTAIPLGILTSEIISNSLKHAYTNRKTGTISINLKTTTDGSIEELMIEDDGNGYETPHTKQGFGLYLCELFAEQLELAMDISTERDQGTRYLFSHKQASSFETDGKIYIVEDERLIAEVRKREVSTFGYEVIAQIPRKGEEAIEYVINAEKKPSLILMDVGLAGEIDGVEAAHRIRERYDIPILFITGYAETKEFQERVKDIPQTSYLDKTTRKERLKQEIENYLSPSI